MSDQFDDDFLNAKRQQLRTKPIAAIEDCRDVYAMVDETHTAATYRLIIFLCDFVKRVRGSTLKRNSLLEHKFWNGPGHKPKEGRLTLVAARFALGARRTRHRHYERARTYAIVIDHYLDLEYTAEEMIEDLNEVTIQGVLDLHKQDGEDDALQGGDASESPEPKAVAKNSSMADSGSTRRSDDSNEQKKKSANNSGDQRPRGASGQVKGRQTDDEELDRGQGDKRRKGKRDTGSAFNSASANDDKPQWKKVDLNEVLPIDPGEYWTQIIGMKKEDCVVITLRCVENKGFKQYRVERIEPAGGGQDEND